MADKKISELTEATTALNDDYLVTDNTASTFKIKKSNLLKELTQTVNGKQAIIEDLDDIRTGAALGETALQEIPDEYVTQTELTNYHDSTKQNQLTTGNGITITNNQISSKIHFTLTDTELDITVDD